MIIAGAGGHAKEVYDILSTQADVYFFDSTVSDHKEIYGCKILFDNEQVVSAFLYDNKYCIGVGTPKLRRQLDTILKNLGGKLVSVISKNAVVSNYNVTIGNGVNIMNNVFISADVKIGHGVLINANASIHHDVTIGDYSEISPGARVLGKAKIGQNCQLGANAVILPQVIIGDNSIIGAGAVVTKNIEANTVNVGVPAKTIKTTKTIS
jgi:sugar O-acyltransferase (sialic acid O-acetyltransferase NeuD family)